MNGIYPSVTPSEIVPTYPQSYTRNKNDTKSSRGVHEVVTTFGNPSFGIPFTTLEKIGSLTFFESVYAHVRAKFYEPWSLMDQKNNYCNFRNTRLSLDSTGQTVQE